MLVCMLGVNYFTIVLIFVPYEITFFSPCHFEFVEHLYIDLL